MLCSGFCSVAEGIVEEGKGGVWWGVMMMLDGGRGGDRIWREQLSNN